MRAERDSKAGQAEVRAGFWGDGRGDNEGARVHWPKKTKAGHQLRGKSVISWSKPEILVQRKMRIEEGKEAAAPLCDQHWHGSLVNRTIVLLKLYP